MIDDSATPNISIDLLDAREKKIAEREAADAAVREINTQIKQNMILAGLDRHQLVDGSIVQIVSPAPREVVVPEVLVQLGVSPKIIQDATRSTPVSSFVRVDRPKGARAEASATDADLSTAPVSDTKQ